MDKSMQTKCIICNCDPIEFNSSRNGLKVKGKSLSVN